VGDDETLSLQLTIEAEGDEEELEDLTTALRRELLELDVSDVTRPVGTGPEGSRGLGVELGQLVVTAGPIVLGPVLATIQTWLANRRKARAVKVKLPNGTEFELDGANPAQVDKLLELVQSQSSQ
jgi:hypothetical protein